MNGNCLSSAYPLFEVEFQFWNRSAGYKLRLQFGPRLPPSGTIYLQGVTCNIKSCYGPYPYTVIFV